MAYDGLSETDLATRLRLPRAVVLGETDSTLDVAHQLAEQGAPAGTLVVADSQRSGRGRLGRAWTSQPGQGVWCTVIERVYDASALDVLSLRVGLRAAEGLDRFAPERIRLKWPNDLLLSSGKLGGILCEARWAGGQPSWVAVGVGVNVRKPEGVPGAAWLREGTDRVDVLYEIAIAVRGAAAASGPLTPEELERYRARDALKGARIASPAAGTVSGIAETGALLVDTARGIEQHRTGTVRLAED